MGVIAREAHPIRDRMHRRTIAVSINQPSHQANVGERFLSPVNQQAHGRLPLGDMTLLRSTE